MRPSGSQRIVKIRRDYNSLVADETMEDYALRFTPKAFRKWSELRIANTALGAVSFLALEAIGGALVMSYGFSNTLWAILAAALVIFLTGLPISYYAARYGVDMDLLTRGAGFGYIGSTITSLIYASFTFLFFALEAAIMALALELYFGIPLALAYVICSVVVIPLVAYGITLINRLQMWSQPLWLVLLLVPYVFVISKNPDVLGDLTGFAGREGEGGTVNLLLFGAAFSVALSLVTQIGEQVDYLRFLPEKTAANRRRWWAALLMAGPGWIIPGALKIMAGAFLAFLALQHEVPIDRAIEPTQMYLVAFHYVFASPEWALAAMTLFVIISQIKINLTNAYAGSLAWSNFFARVTHSHPGRVIWLVFNVIIALVLMELGVLEAIEQVLGLYANIAIAWIGALVADLVINKPLGLSPRHIEFKRAHLYDINPVGVGAMSIASLAAFAAHFGLFGATAQAAPPLISLLIALVVTPLLAWLTRGRYYIARTSPEALLYPHGDQANLQCGLCNNAFEAADMAWCPAYGLADLLAVLFAGRALRRPLQAKGAPVDAVRGPARPPVAPPLPAHAPGAVPGLAGDPGARFVRRPGAGLQPGRPRLGRPVARGLSHAASGLSQGLPDLLRICRGAGLVGGADSGKPPGGAGGVGAPDPVADPGNPGPRQNRPGLAGSEGGFGSGQCRQEPLCDRALP